MATSKNIPGVPDRPFTAPNPSPSVLSLCLCASVFPPCGFSSLPTDQRDRASRGIRFGQSNRILEPFRSLPPLDASMWREHFGDRLFHQPTSSGNSRSHRARIAERPPICPRIRRTHFFDHREWEHLCDRHCLYFRKRRLTSTCVPTDRRETES